MIVDGGPSGRPAFFRGGVSSCCGVVALRSGGAGTFRVRGHTVFLLPDQGVFLPWYLQYILLL